LSRETTIPFETFRRWSVKLKEHADWTSKAARKGAHMGIFTEDEEAEISRDIPQQYPTTHQ
jgi:hypothetical protein